MDKYKSYDELTLESKECQELLKDYPVNNDMEAMAVKVLMTEGAKVYLIPGLVDLTHDELDQLSEIITKIRKDIGLD